MHSIQKRSFQHNRTRWQGYKEQLQAFISAKADPITQPVSYALCLIQHLEGENRKMQKQCFSDYFVNNFVSVKAKHNQLMYLRINKDKKQSRTLRKDCTTTMLKRPQLQSDKFAEREDSDILANVVSKMLEAKDDKQVRTVVGQYCNIQVLSRICEGDPSIYLKELISSGSYAQVAAAVGRTLDMIEFMAETTRKFKSLVQHISSVMDQQNVRKGIESIRSFLVELLKCDKVTMYVVDNKKKEIRSRPKSDLDRIIVLPISSGLVGEAVLSGNVVNVEDAYKHSKFNREMDLRSGYHTKSVLCVPINNSEKQTIAVMQAINKFNQPFNQVDAIVLRVVGRLIKDSLIASFRDDDSDSQQNLTTFVGLLLQISRSKDLTDFILACEEMIKARFGFLQVKLFFYEGDSIISLDKGSKIAKLPGEGSMVAYLKIIKKCFTVVNAYGHPYYNNLVDINTSLPMFLFPIWSEKQDIIGAMEIVTAKGFTSLEGTANILLKSTIEEVLGYLSEIINNLYLEKFLNTRH